MKNILKDNKIRIRMLVWLAALIVCVLFSMVVMKVAAENTYDSEITVFQPLREDYWGRMGDAHPYRLEPGAALKQSFTAQGNTVGEVYEFYLQLFREPDAKGKVWVKFYQESTGEILAESRLDFSDVPECDDLDKMLEETDYVDTLQWCAFFNEQHWFFLKSGEIYHIEVVNTSETDSLMVFGNKSVQSGKMTINETDQPGFVNLQMMRLPAYTPSKFVVLFVLFTDITVLLGLALVLFTNVKTHTLYLVLAMGFGIVTLFDLTSIYGFDMRFQFDSTYVVSNQMLGLGGAVMVPSQADPETEVLSYYRRECDDYSQYQFYCLDEVSANYTDMKVGLRAPFASESGKALRLVETDLGFVGEQLYLYIPQAIGFSIARLLGLGMVPMLMLARFLVYAVFVICVYFAIRRMPFGGRIYLILALMPAVLTQTVSITRDAMIITMAFFLISKVLQMAYGEGQPRKRDWVAVLLVSGLLAPCKMIYLPISFFWLLVIYRKYIREEKPDWKKICLRTVLYALPILCFFILVNLGSISNLAQTDKAGIDGTQAYSVSYILTHIPEAIFVFANTFRMELGMYLANAIQLWNIELGSSDGITIIVLLLLMIESTYICRNREKIRPEERGFFFLVALGVLLLTALASMQWTPVGSNVIQGLQGRYLIPMLPLLCMCFINNKFVRISGKPDIFVKSCCCLYPAFYLMNMYLWTIA